MTYGQTLIKISEVGYKGKYMNKGEMKAHKIDMDHVRILIEDGLMIFTRGGSHKNAPYIWGITSKGLAIVELTKQYAN